MPVQAPPAPAPSPPAALVDLRPRSQRLTSLDVFRGATILGMIIVNNPGTWASVYPPLLHAPWHGWTPTDLVFPFFLFIVGVAIVLAYTRRLAKGADRGGLTKKAATRTLILFGLGVFMAAFPIFTFTPELGFRPALANLRIMGVLQRIALCYFAASLLVLYTRPKVQFYVLAGLLLGYWALMVLVPVPGYGAGQLDAPVGTLAAYVDRAIFGTHLWVGANREWDPEGLLSTLPAMATTLFGVGAGRLLLDDDKTPLDKIVHLFVYGAVLVIIGYVWHWFFPINKSLWTSSYAVFTAGQAMCALALCYWFFDLKSHDRIAKPFVVYGVNALTVFVMSGLLAKSLILIKVSDGTGGTTSLQSVIFKSIFLPLASPVNASLLYALAWVTGWFVVLYVMYRRGIIVKV
ncbi:MAG TPA: DUF5009 domain-containing protein [Rhodothermales bacterium]|nr:DUF5009 domain-containing protein [Rhodothermales bacterium]